MTGRLDYTTEIDDYTTEIDDYTTEIDDYTIEMKQRVSTSIDND